jgi:hypothetical protein
MEYNCYEKDNCYEDELEAARDECVEAYREEGRQEERRTVLLNWWPATQA